MNKHTPGPWEPVLQMDAYPGIPISIRSSHGNVLVAATQHEGDAFLIAAAPELLDALRLARQELAGLPRSLGYYFTHIPKIDAAIAKASGESA
jgi:hypothetical protein